MWRIMLKNLYVRGVEEQIFDLEISAKEEREARGHCSVLEK